ncbi:MAG: F0F1 ATP synthase subunit delta [Patescibacteria group bacterium]
MAKISPKNIAEAVYQATDGKEGVDLKIDLRRTVQILSHKRMLGKSEDVLKALQEIFDKNSRTVRMKVTTAKRIGNTEKHELAEDIKKRYKANEVVSEFFEKVELLGGMRVEVGDEVIDTTYRSRLDKLSKFLMEAK